MKRLIILLAGASLLASNALAGSVSGVPGTLDTTVVDPAPASYPHFICASGCGGGSNMSGTVSQSGAWSVGVINFPALQAVTGTVSLAGSINVANLPVSQTVNGSVAVPGVATAANQPSLNADGGGLTHVMNWPASQVVNGSVAVPGVATAANQPGLNADGGELAHVMNWPASQAVNGSVAVSNLPATQIISGVVTMGGSVAFGAVGSPSPYVETVQGVVGGTPLGVSETDGGDATLGSKADAASGTGSASVVSLLKQIHLDSIGSLPPGSNSIGSVGIAASANAVQPQGFASTAQTSLTNNCYAYGSPTTLFNIAGYASQANLWILLYNAASAPMDGSGTPPVYFYGPLPASGAWSLAFPTPITLSAGMALCYSTTGPGSKTSTTGITAGSAFEEVHS